MIPLTRMLARAALVLCLMSLWSDCQGNLKIITNTAKEEKSGIIESEPSHNSTTDIYTSPQTETSGDEGKNKTSSRNHTELGEAVNKYSKPGLKFVSELMKRNNKSDTVDNGRRNPSFKVVSETNRNHKNGNFTRRKKDSTTTEDSVSSLTDKPETGRESSDGDTHLSKTPLNTFGSNFEEDTITNARGHGDMFRCPPCNCSHTQHRQVIANCTHQKLWNIPEGLPLETWKINMGSNYMKRFNTSAVLEYPSLFTLAITDNPRLKQIVNGLMGNESSKITQLDLSFNNIRFIEDNSFIIMPLLLNLSLSHNYLPNVTNATFQGLGRLEILDLSVNVLRHIEHGAFDHMPHLKVLDLSRNKYIGYYYKRLSPRLFLYLNQLQHLYIQGNSNGELRYPDKALQHLTNLRELTIDGLKDAEFGPEMRNLTKLKYLQLGFSFGRSFCPIETITGTFFNNIPHIESFKVSSCKLMNVNTSAYHVLKNLTSLSYSLLKNYDLFKAFQDMEGLKFSALKTLSLVKLYHSTTPCRYLDKTHAKYIQHLPLEELDLSNNRLALLQDDFLHMLPRTLKRLILRKNKLTLIGTIINRITMLKHLVELDVREQNTEGPREGPSRFAVEQRYTTAQQCRKNPESVTDNGLKCDANNERGGIETTKMIKNQRTKRVKNKTGSSINKPWISIPPNLKILLASSYTQFGSVILVHKLRPENNSLRELDFANSYLVNWGSGKMPPRIKKAVLDYNYCTHIKHNFFPPNSSLEHLSLRNNFLNSDIAEDVTGEIFAELNSTLYLDLSWNYIYKVPTMFFKGLNSLRTLRLSNNKLQVLNVSFANMKYLTMLDLSKNSITWIQKQTRDDLDELHELNLDLTDNPLPCTCAGLEVLTWMATTNVYLLNSDFLKCRLDNGQTESVGDLQERAQSLRRQCISARLIVVICIASFLIVSIIVAFGFTYRYRWRLRYLKNIALARMLGLKPKLNDAEYRFDAYILYGDDAHVFVVRELVKELEEKRGHRLCIEDRNFMLGTVMGSNIQSAIQCSAKTVPVVTPGFYNRDFSEYSLKMAIMEEKHRRRSILHLCRYVPMPVEELSRDFLMLMDRKDYTEFPLKDEVTEEVMQSFWDKLSQAIGHHGNRNEMGLRN